MEQFYLHSDFGVLYWPLPKRNQGFLHQGIQDEPGYSYCFQTETIFKKTKQNWGILLKSQRGQLKDVSIDKVVIIWAS